MTRLYVDIHCENCGKPYAVEVGEYFGKRINDEPIKCGLCIWCRLEKEKEGDGNDA